MKKDSGLFGIGGLFAGIVALVIARRYFPSLANILLSILGICVVLLVLLVIAVMYFALRKPKKTPEQIAKDANQEVINAGRRNLMALRRMSMEIKNARIRTLSTEICGVIERIFRVLKESPDDVSSLRQFFHYYLPTLEKIMTKYKELESRGVPSSEITQSTIACLEDIKVAMEKQYDHLFADDILDLTVEMEVLTQMCKRDGLLSEADFNTED